MDFYFYNTFIVKSRLVFEREKERKKEIVFVCEKNVWKWKIGNINTYLVSSLFLNDLLIAHQPTSQPDTHLFTSDQKRSCNWVYKFTIKLYLWFIPGRGRFILKCTRHQNRCEMIALFIVFCCTYIIFFHSACKKKQSQSPTQLRVQTFTNRKQ